MDANYNSNHPAIQVDIPADAEKVELGTVFSGHGQVSPGNCGEFCELQNWFSINGVSKLVSYPDAGSERGCMYTAEQGTVPNQYGTWWYGRDGWCPGREVPMELRDISAEVQPGALNTFGYEAYYNGGDHPGGANIVLSAWLIVSK